MNYLLIISVRHGLFYPSFILLTLYFCFEQQKSLPYLRYSLLKEELTIDGVRAPHSNTVTITPNGMAIGNGTAQAAAQQAQQQAQAAAVAQMTGQHGLTQLQVSLGLLLF